MKNVAGRYQFVFIHAHAKHMCRRGGEEVSTRSMDSDWLTCDEYGALPQTQAGADINHQQTDMSMNRL